ncbi:MAG TPA: trypsin-like peptidase domain-containing protein [Pirellulaceae bacterium]|nr:trypsin-like peptidase domain-containing protein [Pirellulaceae bacterium]
MSFRWVSAGLGSLVLAAAVSVGWWLPSRAVAVPAETLDSLRAKQERIREVVRSAMPATVVVTDGIGSGSGVIVSEDGIVLTAAHVLMTGGPELEVIFADGRTVKATALGLNRDVDAGMLKLDEPGPWPHVEMAEPSSAEAGDWCVVLGHPGGYQLGRTPPVRVGRILAYDKTVVLTDCALIGGDSGGPLFDLDGKLIGIHSSIGETIDQNRHVPIGAFEASWDRLLAGESWGRLGRLVDLAPNRPMLGVRLDSLANEQVIVADLVPDSPAAKAGVLAGDRIVSIDGIEIRRPIELIEIVLGKQVGERVRLIVERDGATKRIDVDLTRSGALDLNGPAPSEE